MTFRQACVRVLLICLALLPATLFGTRAVEAHKELLFASSKLDTIRKSIGQAQADVRAANTTAKNLASVGVRAWGVGDAQQRIGAAFQETDLMVEPFAGSQVVQSSSGKPLIVPFRKIVVKAKGSVRAAKEALWNLGDLGPGIRMETFRGEFEPASKTVNWTFELLAINNGPTGHSNQVPQNSVDAP